LLDERGWLHLRGRERDEINKGGMKISPAEVDAAAEGCPGVAEVCAFALDDPLYGQNVGLAVALTGAGDVVVRDLYRWMRERLAEAKLPARWWLVEAIPRSARGKVSRDEVRDACAGRPALDLTRILQGR
jgi:acyl-CoA synthetase (AMP-forming)/AMP-acid ligase II